MKKETFNEVLQMYLNSEDDKALFISRLRLKKKTKQPLLSYSEKTLIRIKDYLSTKKYQKNEALENQMILNTDVTSVAVLEKDKVCVHHLKLEVENLNSNTENVRLSIYNDRGESVKTHDLEWNDMMDVSLKGLRTGRYYWTLANESILQTGRIYRCTPIDAAMIRDSNF